MKNKHPVYKQANYKAYRLLKDLSNQLNAMNTSPAHAASWIETKSSITKKRIKRINRVIGDLLDDMAIY